MCVCVWSPLGNIYAQGKARARSAVRYGATHTLCDPYVIVLLIGMFLQSLPGVWLILVVRWGFGLK